MIIIRSLSSWIGVLIERKITKLQHNLERVGGHTALINQVDKRRLSKVLLKTKSVSVIG